MWNSLSGNAKFSIIAFVVTAVLGLLSMGALGAILYYPVSFLLKKLPPMNHWHGDWVWPAMIAVGMLWSLGFIFGGAAWYYLAKITSSKLILYAAYIFILWIWAAILWYYVITHKM
jgi:hypothetical protein